MAGDELAPLVQAASRAWVWVPPDAEDVTTGDYRLTHYPDRSCVQWSRTSRPFEQVLYEVCARTSEAGRDRLRWWVSEGTEPAGTSQALTAAGFTLRETVDVLALHLPGSAAELVRRLAVPPGVEVRPADDEAALRAAAGVDQAVFDWPPPSPALMESALRAARDGLRTGRWSERQFLALLDGAVVGHGGLTLVAGGPRGGLVARLWGGAVLPSARGRGAYRALLAARCAFAVEQGATLALVKGRVATSAPILRRAGFAAFGQESCYETRLGGTSEPSSASSPR